MKNEGGEGEGVRVCRVGPSGCADIKLDNGQLNKQATRDEDGEKAGEA